MEYSPLLVLVVVIILLLVFLLSGMPVAFAFLSVNIIGLTVFLGGYKAWYFLVLSAYEVLTSFEMLAVVFFLLMGEVLGILGATRTLLDTTDKLVGFIPARLTFIAIMVSTVFGALSGSSLGACASIGSTFGPLMREKGYKNPIVLGPIMGGAVLDMLIPPSAFAVILATMAHISVGKILIGGIGPGLLLSGIFMVYVFIRVLVDPSLAPMDKPPGVSIMEKVRAILHIAPLAFLFFLVTGTLFFGIATPTEASALGALGAFVVAGLQRKLNWEGVKKAILESGKIVGMIFLILMTSKCFSQFLAGTGVIGTILETVVKIKLPVWAMVTMMQLVGLILGMFIDGFSILMITLPIFMPILDIIKFDPLLFAIAYLVNQGIGSISPPFGTVLFVMKGVSGPDVSMEEIYRAAIPICLLILLGMLMVFALPQIALWLPDQMIGTK